MNCCDDCGNCRQGRDCPVRYACAIEAPAKADRWDRIVGYALALAGCVVLAILYAEWLAGRL